MIPGLGMTAFSLSSLYYDIIEKKHILLYLFLLGFGLAFIICAVFVIKGSIMEYWGRHPLCKTVTGVWLVFIVIAVVSLFAFKNHVFDMLIIIGFCIAFLMPLNLIMWLFAALNDDLEDIKYLKNICKNKREEEEK